VLSHCVEDLTPKYLKAVPPEAPPFDPQAFAVPANAAPKQATEKMSIIKWELAD